MVRVVRAPLVACLFFRAVTAAAQTEPLPPPPAPTREDAALPPAPTREDAAPSQVDAAATRGAAAPSQEDAAIARDATRDLETTLAPSHEKEDRFGDRGQWIFSGAIDASLTHDGYSDSDASRTSFAVTPSVDWFVADGFSIGAYAGASVTSTTAYATGSTLETTTTTAWSAGARFGGALRLGRLVTWWPRVGFSYGASHTGPSSDSNGHSLSDRGGNVNAYAPLLFHLAPHAFVGIGPSVTRTLAHVQEGYARSFGNGTIVGAGVIVGGWL